MKVVILAGGLGTRLSEETVTKPKPLVEIGGRPIIWHLMNFYASYGMKEFIICCGYKGYLIKEYFYNLKMHHADFSIDYSNSSNINYLNGKELDWKVTLVDTGEDTLTGGRLKRVSHLLEDDFHFTYGDGLSNVNLSNLLNFHKSHGKLATITAVKPPGRFGALKIENTNSVSSFSEKPDGDGGFINGGFFILKKEVIDYIDDDYSIWEREPLENLSHDEQLQAYKHDGFWHPMDTLRDKNYLESIVNSKDIPWMKK